MVDVDATELKKPTLSPSLAIHADLAGLPAPARGLANAQQPALASKHSGWLAWGRERGAAVSEPSCPSTGRPSRGHDPYCFVDVLFDQLPTDQIVVTGDGTACVVTFQAAKIQKQQRLYTNSGVPRWGTTCRRPSSPVSPAVGGRSSAWPATAASR